VSPVLANLYMHYAFDVWMARTLPKNPWCRYADDGLVHCWSRQEAEGVLAKLKQRMQECGVEIHPDKTRIVYCADYKKKEPAAHKKFTLHGIDLKKQWTTLGFGKFSLSKIWLRICQVITPLWLHLFNHLNNISLTLKQYVDSAGKLYQSHKLIPCF